jgi:hypothetical protein
MSYLEIELTAVDWRNEPSPAQAQPQLRVVENDLEQEVEEEATHDFPGQPQPADNTYPITVNLDDLREYYPRRRGRSGTRLVYKNGAGRPVQESYTDVRAKIAAAVASLNGGRRAR